MDLEVGIKVEDLFKKFCKESKNQKTALNLKMDKKKRGLKHILYKAINSFGYKISNKKRERKTIENELAKYGVHSHYSLLLHSSQYVFALQKIFPDLRISDYELGGDGTEIGNLPRNRIPSAPQYNRLSHHPPLYIPNWCKFERAPNPGFPLSSERGYKWG